MVTAQRSSNRMKSTSGEDVTDACSYIRVRGAIAEPSGKVLYMDDSCQQYEPPLICVIRRHALA